MADHLTAMPIKRPAAYSTKAVIRRFSAFNDRCWACTRLLPNHHGCGAPDVFIRRIMIDYLSPIQSITESASLQFVDVVVQPLNNEDRGRGNG